MTRLNLFALASTMLAALGLGLGLGVGGGSKSRPTAKSMSAVSTTTTTTTHKRSSNIAPPAVSAFVALLAPDPHRTMSATYTVSLAPNVPITQSYEIRVGPEDRYPA